MLSVKSIGGFIIVSGVAIFILHMFLTTYYQIEETKLKIKCGFLFRQEIDIETIKRISETDSWISSPASSLDRLEIKYLKNKKVEGVIVSPKHKDAFIQMLTDMNPAIEVRLKHKK
ncbi:MAG: PH domain-containing protein [Ignavibacteria bacterium]|nr:PH domain-containing protein [Ignavibacteria bacterium]